MHSGGSLICRLRFVGFDQPAAEKEVLLYIARVDISKIRGYLKDVTAGQDAVNGSPSAIRERLGKVSTSEHTSETHTVQQFLDWLKHIPTCKEAPSKTEPEALLHHLTWAAEGRKYYPEVLKLAFHSQLTSLPRWVLSILKLSRYSVAAKAMIRLVSEYPCLFNKMTVEAVPAPGTTCSTPSIGDSPLQSVLRRVVGHLADEYIGRLAKVWNTTNAEAHFQQSCSRNLTVHAEAQLISFYDHNKHLRPSFRFMGVSKKSCYSCILFLTAHPSSIGVSSCHQKIYPSWYPPKASDHSTYRQYKSITNDMCKIMEAAAKQDLDGRLGFARRAIPADSTAGISLGGLTTASTTGLDMPNLDELRRPRPDASASTVWEEESLRLDGASDCPTSHEPVAVVVSRNPRQGRHQQASRTVAVSQCSLMAFHVMSAEDPTRQNIICSRDLMVPSAEFPSWSRFIDIVSAEGEQGLSFKEGSDYFMFEKRIRVTNERQFLACLQYLNNLDILSSEVYIHSSSGLRAAQNFDDNTSFADSEEPERPSKKHRVFNGDSN